MTGWGSAIAYGWAKRSGRSRPAEAERHRRVDPSDAEFQHQQTVEAERNAGATRQPAAHRREQPSIDFGLCASVAPADRPILAHASFQDLGVHEFIVPIGNFDSVDD